MNLSVKNEMELRLTKVDILLGEKTLEEMDGESVTKAYASIVVGVRRAIKEAPELKSEIENMCRSYFLEDHENQLRALCKRHKELMNEYGYRQRPKEFFNLMKKIDDGCNFHMAE